VLAVIMVWIKAKYPATQVPVTA